MDRDTILMLCAAGLLLVACGPRPPGVWTLVDPTGQAVGPSWDVQAWAEEAIAVTGDLSGFLADGGTVEIVVGLGSAGSAVPGLVRLTGLPRFLDPFRSAIAHEFGHLGLTRDEIHNCSEADAEAAAAAIIPRMRARLGLP